MAGEAVAASADREPLVDLGEGELDLLFPHGMRGRFRLPLEVRLRQAKRLELAQLLGVELRLCGTAPPPLGFPFFDLFLDARFRVDEAFSGVTHNLCNR